MSIYYQDKLITLYHGDCLEITDWLAADVLVTDPPYGMAYKSNRGANHQSIANDQNAKIRNQVLALWHDKPALVFGTWRIERPLNTRNVLVWDKGDDPGMGDLSMPWGNSHEEIYVIGKPFYGKRTSNVLRHNKPPIHSDGRAHPTPKPIGLMQQLIERTQGVIAEPFAGSGATLLAARNLGRQVIAVELEEVYCELIATRLSQQVFEFDN